MSTRILVTLDGSNFAERALNIAIEFAQQRKAELTLLQVAPLQGRVAPAEEYLASKAEAVRSKGVDCTTQVLLGTAPEVIVEQSSYYQLIVMTSHGHSQFDRMILGSVAEKVVRRSHCPIFVLRDRQVHLRELKRVMVPLDGFSLSEIAIPEAVQVCEATGGTLILSRVNEAVGFEVGLLSKESEGKVMEQYLNAHARAITADLEVQTRYDFGSAARTLLRMIDRENIDLVVMASHGRGGFNRWVCGSVAENVLRSSLAPVMIVRPTMKEEETAAEEAGQLEMA